MQPDWMPAMPELTGVVVGVGIDIVELDELRACVVDRANVLGRVFTAAELAYCEGPQRLERLGARFAAKEAAFKAVGTGWAGAVTWQDAEVVSRPGAPPELAVRGALLRHARARGGTRFELSLSHSGGYAAAIAVLVASPIAAGE